MYVCVCVCVHLFSVPNYHQSVSPKPTTLEDWELFFIFFFKFMFMISVSRHKDQQLFWLSFEHWCFCWINFECEYTFTYFQKIVDTRQRRKQRRSDMAKRRTLAAQQRMKIITELAQGKCGAEYLWRLYLDGLVQNCSNSSAVAIEPSQAWSPQAIDLMCFGDWWLYIVLFFFLYYFMSHESNMILEKKNLFV